jgi:serine protease
VGGFLAGAAGAALAVSGMSAAGASTLSAHTSDPAQVRVAARPHGGAIAAANPHDLIYHGGPVENAPRVFVVYWGWTSDPSGEKPYLSSLLSSVGGSSWLSTVGQYGGGDTGNLLAGTWADSASVPTRPTDAQVQAEARKAAGHFGTGTSYNVEIVVATPTGHSESGFGTQFCAYHGDISADPNVTYTYLPYMTDAGAACGENAVNGGLAGLLDGVSIIEGHVLAESITDPLFNAWIDANGFEISDTCAWVNLADVVMPSGRTFAMQPLWSNAAGGCVI